MITMPDLRDGACATTRINMAPSAKDKAGIAQARQVCITRCPAFLRCARWVDEMLAAGDFGSDVLAGTSEAGRMDIGGLKQCVQCEAWKRQAAYAFADSTRTGRRAKCRKCVQDNTRAKRASAKAQMEVAA